MKRRRLKEGRSQKPGKLEAREGGGRRGQARKGRKDAIYGRRFGKDSSGSWLTRLAAGCLIFAVLTFSACFRQPREEEVRIRVERPNPPPEPAPQDSSSQPQPAEPAGASK